MSLNRLVCGCLAVWLAGQTAWAEEFQSAREAYSVGAAFHNAGSYAKAQAPFEAALKLSDDVKFRIDCYRALLSSYRLLESPEKMTEAVEYILKNSERTAEKSLTQRSYLSFIHQRGLTEKTAARYEERLQAQPEDIIAISILADIYGQLIEKPARAAELTQQLQKLVPVDPKDPVKVLKQAELARQLSKAKKYKEAAELYETIAPQDPKLAAWHWKEAATNWVQENDLVRAKQAALQSTMCEPELRNDQLTYFWSRGLADLLLQFNEYEQAVLYYDLALTKNTNPGYVKDTQAKLEEAKSKLNAK